MNPALNKASRCSVTGNETKLLPKWEYADIYLGGWIDDVTRPGEPSQPCHHLNLRSGKSLRTIIEAAAGNADLPSVACLIGKHLFLGLQPACWRGIAQDQEPQQSQRPASMMANARHDPVTCLEIAVGGTKAEGYQQPSPN